MVDPAELLTNLEEEISKAKQEVASRRDIMVLMEKWMSACEEEGWLEDYNKVSYYIHKLSPGYLFQITFISRIY